MSAHGPGALPIDAAAGTLLKVVAGIRVENVAEVGVAASRRRRQPAPLFRRRLDAAQRRLAHEAACEAATPIVKEKTPRRRDDEIRQDTVTIVLRSGLLGKPWHVKGRRLDEGGGGGGGGGGEGDNLRMIAVVRVGGVWGMVRGMGVGKGKFGRGRSIKTELMWQRDEVFGTTTERFGGLGKGF